MAASAALKAALEATGARVEILPAEADLPDLVFTANAAVVLDGKALLARFRHPERRGEEVPFRAAFQGFVARGLLRAVAELPAGVFHEGAGDALWDDTRQLFWTGYGQRSDAAAGAAIAAAFGRPVVPLELASPRFYHLDTCLRPLSGGEVLYYPPAFTPDALRRIEAHVAPAERLAGHATRTPPPSASTPSAWTAASSWPAPPAALRQRLEARG